MEVLQFQRHFSSHAKLEEAFKYIFEIERFAYLCFFMFIIYP